MVATAPGAPKTSNTTCLGLNATMLFSAPLGVEVTSREPKMPFSRYTANPATTTTSTATSSIHRRLSTPPNETRCIPDPFDERRHVDRRWDASLGDINQVTVAQVLVDDDGSPNTGRDVRRFWAQMARRRARGFVHAGLTPRSWASPDY